MWNLAAEIAAVEREHSLGVRRLPAADRDLLRERVLARYGGGTSRMWEAAAECASVRNGDGWRWISRFVGSRPCVLLFDAGEEAEMFRLPSGEALTLLLENCSGFEFYVTDMDAGYLVCFNHHDVLVCCGSAREWLEGLDPESSRDDGQG